MANGRTRWETDELYIFDIHLNCSLPLRVYRLRHMIASESCSTIMHVPAVSHTLVFFLIQSLVALVAPADPTAPFLYAQKILLQEKPNTYVMKPSEMFLKPGFLKPCKAYHYVTHSLRHLDLKIGFIPFQRRFS